jgi:hypothetical protein
MLTQFTDAFLRGTGRQTVARDPVQHVLCRRMVKMGGKYKKYLAITQHNNSNDKYCNKLLLLNILALWRSCSDFLILHFGTT